MENNIIQFEEQTRELVYSILSNKKDDLRKVGISSEKIKFNKSEQSRVDYKSEVEITFWSGNDLIDVVEFPVFREGKIVAQINELKIWLEEKLNEVIKQG